jgi:hypothetical protein
VAWWRGGMMITGDDRHEKKVMEIIIDKRR